MIRACSALLLALSAGVLLSISGVSSERLPSPTKSPVALSAWEHQDLSLHQTDFAVGSFRINRPSHEKFIGGLRHRLEEEGRFLFDADRFQNFFKSSALDKFVYDKDSIKIGDWWVSQKDVALRRLLLGSVDYSTDYVLSAVQGEVNGLSFVRNVEWDYQSSLGDRRWQLGLNALGAFRETSEDALVWQLRGFASEDSSAGGNVGLIYRRVVERSEDEALLGGNVFLDYENNGDYDESFWRWSLGLEYRSPWFDLFANRYLAITDGQVLSNGDIAYSQSGYELELGLHAPSVNWVSGGLTYFNWEGEYGESDNNGFRYNLRFTPFNGGIVNGLELELELEDSDNDDLEWGGRISYRHRFNVGDEAGALRFSKEGFDPRAYFFEPVRREYSQRLRRVSSTGVIVSAVVNTGELTYTHISATVVVSDTSYLGTVNSVAISGTVFAFTNNITATVESSSPSETGLFSPSWTLGIAADSSFSFIEAGQVLSLERGTLTLFRVSSSELTAISTPETTVRLLGTTLEVGYSNSAPSVSILLLDGTIAFSSKASESSSVLVSSGLASVTYLTAGVSTSLLVGCGRPSYRYPAGSEYASSPVCVGDMGGLSNPEAGQTLELVSSGETLSISGYTGGYSVVVRGITTSWLGFYPLERPVSGSSYTLINQGGDLTLSFVSESTTTMVLSVRQNTTVEVGYSEGTLVILVEGSVAIGGTEFGCGVSGGGNLGEVIIAPNCGVPLSLAEEILPIIAEGRVTSLVTLSALGGRAPYRYVVNNFPEINVAQDGFSVTLSLVSGLSVALHPFTVIVSDASGAAATQSFTLDVQEGIVFSPSTRRVILSQDTSGVVATALATGVSLGVVTYEIVPPGIANFSIDTNTGVVNLSPAVGASGEMTLSIQASDSGLSGNEAILNLIFDIRAFVTLGTQPNVDVLTIRQDAPSLQAGFVFAAEEGLEPYVYSITGNPVDIDVALINQGSNRALRLSSSVLQTSALVVEVVDDFSDRSSSTVDIAVLPTVSAVNGEVSFFSAMSGAIFTLATLASGGDGLYDFNVLSINPSTLDISVSSDGLVLVNTTLEADRSSTLVFVVSDLFGASGSYGKSATSTLTINVQQGLFFPQATLSVALPQDTSGVVATALAAGVSMGPVTYEILSPGIANFSIDTNTGVVNLSPTVSAPGVMTLSIQALDTALSSNRATFELVFDIRALVTLGTQPNVDVLTIRQDAPSLQAGFVFVAEGGLEPYVYSVTVNSADIDATLINQGSNRALRLSAGVAGRSDLVVGVEDDFADRSSSTVNITILPTVNAVNGETSFPSALTGAIFDLVDLVSGGDGLYDFSALSINPSTLDISVSSDGVLLANTTLEAERVATLVFVVSDSFGPAGSYGKSATSTLTLDIQQGLFFPEAVASVILPQDISGVVATASVEGVSMGAVTYEILSPGIPNFSIDTNTGVVTLSPTLSASGVMTLSIRASDSGLSSNRAVFALVFDIRTLVTLGTQSDADVLTIRQDAPSLQAGFVFAAEEGLEPYVYSITGNPAGIDAILINQGSNRALRLSSSVAQTSALIVEVVDDFSDRALSTVSINVLPTVSAVNGDFSFPSAITGAIFTLDALVSGGDGLYDFNVLSINPSTLDISVSSDGVLLANTTLEAERTATLVFAVSDLFGASGSYGKSATSTLTINIQQGIFFSQSIQSVTLSQDTSGVVATALAAGVSTGPVTYEILPPGITNFSIDTNTGVVSLSPTLSASGVMTLSIQASDTGLSSNRAVFALVFDIRAFVTLGTQPDTDVLTIRQDAPSLQAEFVFAAGEGLEPYVYSITGNPANIDATLITQGSNGVLRLSSSVEQTSALVVEVVDDFSDRALSTISINVLSTVSAMSRTVFIQPTVTGEVFNLNDLASGGNGIYNFVSIQIISDRLVVGLDLHIGQTIGDVVFYSSTQDTLLTVLFAVRDSFGADGSYGKLAAEATLVLDPSNGFNILPSAVTLLEGAEGELFSVEIDGRGGAGNRNYQLITPTAGITINADNGLVSATAAIATPGGSSFELTVSVTVVGSEATNQEVISVEVVSSLSFTAPTEALVLDEFSVGALTTFVAIGDGPPYTYSLTPPLATDLADSIGVTDEGELVLSRLLNESTEAVLTIEVEGRLGSQATILLTLDGSSIPLFEAGVRIINRNIITGANVLVATAFATFDNPTYSLQGSDASHFSLDTDGRVSILSGAPLGLLSVEILATHASSRSFVITGEAAVFEDENRIYIYGGEPTSPTIYASSGRGGNWHRVAVTVNPVFSNGGVVLLSNTLYLLEGSGSQSVWSSEDGEVWTALAPTPNGSNQGWRLATHRGSLYWSGVSGNAQVWSSPDGITWTRIAANAEFGNILDHGFLSFAGSLWVIAGGSANVWSSADGVSWDLQTNAAAFGLRFGQAAAVFNNAMWVLGGGLFAPDAYSSTDGVNWEYAGNLPATNVNGGIAAIVSGGNLIFADNSGNVYASEDGSSWTDVNSNGLPDGLPSLFSYGLVALVQYPSYQLTLLPLNLPTVSETYSDDIATLQVRGGSGDFSFSFFGAAPDIQIDLLSGVLSVPDGISPGEYTYTIRISDSSNASVEPLFERISLTVLALGQRLEAISHPIAVGDAFPVATVSFSGADADNVLYPAGFAIEDVIALTGDDASSFTLYPINTQTFGVSLLTPTVAAELNLEVSLSIDNLANNVFNSGIRVIESGQTISTPSGNERLFVYAQQESFGAGATLVNIFTSDDLGETWTTQAPTGASLYLQLQGRNTPPSGGTYLRNSVYIMDRLGHTWRSLDGINDWVSVGRAPVDEGELIGHEGTLWLFSGLANFQPSTNNVWYSTDGASWNLGGSGGVGSLIPDATNPVAFRDRGLVALKPNNELWFFNVDTGSFASSVNIFVNTIGATASWRGIDNSEVSPLGLFERQRLPEMHYFNGRFWLLGGRNASGSTGNLAGAQRLIWSSVDGTTWEASGNLEATGFTNGALIPELKGVVIEDRLLYIPALGTGNGEVWYKTTADSFSANWRRGGTVNGNEDLNQTPIILVGPGEIVTEVFYPSYRLVLNDIGPLNVSTTAAIASHILATASIRNGVGAYTYSLNTDESAILINATSGVLSLGGALTAGTYSFTIFATDNSGALAGDSLVVEINVQSTFASIDFEIEKAIWLASLNFIPHNLPLSAEGANVAKLSLRTAVRSAQGIGHFPSSEIDYKLGLSEN